MITSMKHILYNKRGSFFAIFLSALFFLSCSKPFNEDNNIHDGILNLSSYDFDKDIIEIGGYSNFYWEQFLSLNGDYQQSVSKDSISITHSWDNQPGSSNNYTSKGFASYHFAIKIPEEYVGKYFKIRPNHFISYASEIYINRQLVCNNGSVGKSEVDANYQPSRRTTTSPFIADSSVLECIVWCANFDHFRGGIFQKLSFGLAPVMQKKRESAITFDLIVIISLLIMFIYHFVLHFVNFRERAALLFSITCFIYAIDLSFQDSMSFFLFFPEINFKIYSFLHLSMPYLIPTSFIFFLHALFPIDVSKTVRNITLVVAFFMVVSTLLDKDWATSYLVKPHFGYNLLVVFYIYFAVIKAVVNKREGAILFLIAYIIFSSCAINDILFVYEFIYTANMVSTGLLVFIILVSILQGRRLATMYKNNEKLTEHLKELNVDLENKVSERTHELNLSLEAQRKLSLFKEDMTNTIIHDLKTPLNAIINANLIEDENSRLSMIQQSGYRMLNLVQNIIGVYRSENAEIELNKQKVDLLGLINRAFSEISFSANQKSVKLKLDRKVKYWLLIDEDILVRVFVNFLSNAINYSPNNSVIEIKISSTENSTAKIFVCNQGPGIPQEQQKLVFNMFEQGGLKSNRASNSSGLGLAFCKMAVEAHGGEIGVVSEGETGVEFWFTLPKAICYISEDKNHSNSEQEIATLTETDIDYLKVFIAEMVKYEIFEISAINSILKRIEHRSSEIEWWLTEIEKAVFSGDNKKFKELLKL